MKRFQNRNYELEDLYQIGCIGFIKAIRNFDFSKQNQLSTYATYMVIGEIKRFFRDNGPIKVSRSLKELALKIKYLQESRINEKEKEWNIEELSQLLHIEKEEIILALEASLSVESIEQKIGDEEGQALKDKLTDPKDDYETLMNEMILQKALHHLEEKEKKIVMLRYYREMTQTQIAQLLSMSQVQVSRVEKRAMEKMKKDVLPLE